MFHKFSGFVLVVLLLAGCGTVPTKKVDLPVLEIEISKKVLEPGHCLKITAVTDKAVANIQAAGWWDGELTLAEVPERQNYYEHYVTVPLDTTPDSYTITVTAYSDNLISVSQSQTIVVKPRSPFKTVKLWIKSFGKYDFASESALMSEARQKALEVQAIFQPINRIDWPVKGRLTETFGVKRIYNGGLDSWYHGGLDIAAPGGTIIKAPADGVVILSKDFTAHGKTILINHGYGVVTTYLHQKKRLVETGEVVKKGQPIGWVGTTGSSTGNHLHFQINVNNIITNPYDFF